MTRIRTDEILVEHVGTSGLQEEYIVEKNAHLTLIIVARVTETMELSPFVRLIGEQSRATILGVVFGSGKGAVTIKTLQHHQAPNTTSSLLIKSVMADESECNYEGSIVVDTQAQKTDAYQRNENLLLGDHARAVSKPALEILANDVRCTHGAIVKTLDPMEVWYAATRGIGRQTARAMITTGFLSSTFDAIGDTILRGKMYDDVASLCRYKEVI